MPRFITLLLLTTFVFLAASPASADEQATMSGTERERIEKGLNLAPLPLEFDASERDRVGLGSYLVNALGACNDCHTPNFEPFLPGGNPFEGEPEKINTARYLIGGAVLEPTGVVSRSLRRDPESGRPANLSVEQFLSVMRRGVDVHDEQFQPPDTPILQAMPWPFYQHLTDADLRAMYAYLMALPPLPGAHAPAESGAQ